VYITASAPILHGPVNRWASRLSSSSCRARTSLSY
jgi:hypothetical protein